MASDAVVNLVVDASDAENSVRVQLTRIVNDAERRAPEINLNVNVDTDSVRREVRGLRLDLEDNLGQLNAGLREGFRDLTDLLSNQIDETNFRLRRMDESLRDVTSELRQMARQASRTDDEVDDLNRSLSDGEADSDRFGAALGRIGGAARGILGLATSLATVGAALGTAVPLAAGLAVAIESIIPAGAALISGFVTMQAATLTLKAGLIGVSDAVNEVFAAETDPAKLAEALERLAPEARKFVLQLNEMKPALRDLQLDVQNRLFKDFDDQLSSLSTAAMPAVRQTALSMADSFNAMGRGVTSAASQLAAEGSLGKALGSSERAMQNLEKVPGQILVSLGRLASAGGPLLERFTEGLAEKVERLTDRLGKAFESGALEESVNNAGETINQLGRIAGNVFGTISNILGTANASGAGLFSTLESVTQTLEDFTGTKVFQDALAALQSVMGNLADTVLPLFTTALGMLLPVITELAPFVNELVDTLGAELAKTLPEATPILAEATNLFRELIPIIGELLPPLFEIVRAALPLMAIYLDLVTKGLMLIGPALVGVTTFFADLATLVSGFAVGAFRSFERMGSIVVDLLQGNFSDALNTAKGGVSSFTTVSLQYLASLVSGGRQRLIEFGAGVLRSIGDARRYMVDGISRAISDTLSRLASLPGAAVNTLGGIGRVLYQSGVSLVSGFVAGIIASIPSVSDAVGRVAAAARDYLPFSPAKKGPLSGRGYTTFSGAAMIRDFARGIMSQQGAVESALAATLAPAGAGTLTGTADARQTGFLTGLTVANSLAPTVNVYVGNERLDSHIDVRIGSNNDDRDRQAAQGVRF